MHEDITLRRWHDSDAGQIAEIATDPAIQQWNPMKPADALEWCRHRADWSNGTHASWAVVDANEQDRLLGSVSLFLIDRDQQACELGFWTAPAARGRRVAARAVRAATAYAFTQLALRRVVMFHAVDNPGSCRVANSAGFVLEGVHRGSYRYGDGDWHDEHSHARLATDGAPT